MTFVNDNILLSFIIHDPDDLPLHTRVPDLKSRTPLAQCE